MVRPTNRALPPGRARRPGARARICDGDRPSGAARSLAGATLALSLVVGGCGGAAPKPKPATKAAAAQGSKGRPRFVSPARLFALPGGTGVTTRLVDPDGTQRLVVHGMRMVEHVDGSMERAKQIFPGGRSVSSVALPERLGGGYVFFTNASGTALIWRAKSWAGRLEPLANVDLDVQEIVPGFDRLYVVDRRSVDVVALDSETGQPTDLGFFAHRPGLFGHGFRGRVAGCGGSALPGHHGDLRCRGELAPGRRVPDLRGQARERGHRDEHRQGALALGRQWRRSPRNGGGAGRCAVLRRRPSRQDAPSRGCLGGAGAADAAAARTARSPAAGERGAARLSRREGHCRRRAPRRDWAGEPVRRQGARRRRARAGGRGDLPWRSAGQLLRLRVRRGARSDHRVRIRAAARTRARAALRRTALRGIQWQRRAGRARVLLRGQSPHHWKLLHHRPQAESSRDQGQRRRRRRARRGAFGWARCGDRTAPLGSAGSGHGGRGVRQSQEHEAEAAQGRRIHVGATEEGLVARRVRGDEEQEGRAPGGLGGRCRAVRRRARRAGRKSRDWED